MSIVRIGLGETKGFSDGYEAIFGKKKTEAEPARPKASKAPGKKKGAKKKGKK